MSRVCRVLRDSAWIPLVLLALLMSCSSDDPASAPETEACAVTVSTPTADGDVVVNLPDEGSFVWDIDSFNHGTDDLFWFEIRDHELPDCVGVSRDVEIFDDDICSMLVISPADGAVWRLGETRSIEFQQTNGNGRVNIILKAGQTFLGYIATGYDVAMGPLDLVVSNYGFEGPDTMYRIDVVDVEDEHCRAESRIFTILR